MDWLTENKLPVGEAASTIFEWVRDNGEIVLEVFSDLMELLIDALLWLLQTPSPLIVIAFFVALAWFVQRSWKTCLVHGNRRAHRHCRGA